VPHEDQLHTHLERILSNVREQLDGSLRTAAEEIVRAASAERDRAVLEATADAKRRADEDAAELREAGRKQADEVRATAEVQIAALRNLLDEARLDAQHQIDTSRRTLEHEAAAAHAAAASEVEEARRVAHARIEELERQAEDRVHAVERDLAAVRAELALARSEAEAARSTHSTGAPAVANDLAAALRSLDEARSLSMVFEQLADSAMRSTERCALFLVKGDGLQPWRVAGFERDPSDIPIADAGLAGAAVADRRVVTRRQSDGPALPAFAAGQDRDAAAIPVMIAGVPVAVLYADSTPAPGASSAWQASLEVVTRHAARVLETIAVRQATGILTAAPMARESLSQPGPSHPGSAW
jgi:hypothetical protein